jgi:hypothetical protein
MHPKPFIKMMDDHANASLSNTFLMYPEEVCCAVMKAKYLVGIGVSRTINGLLP